MTGQPDIRLTVRARNARLLRALEAAGFDSTAAFARALGGRTIVGPGSARYQQIVSLVTFRLKPVLKNGGWRDIALEVATALHMEPEDLWPEYLRDVEMTRPEVSIDVSVDQFAALVSGERLLIEHEAIDGLLAKLKPRDRTIIEMRYGLNGNGQHTCREIGEAMGVDSATVNAAEHRALYLMRRRLPEDAESADFLGDP
jgi:Sigma-70, region 4